MQPIPPPQPRELLPPLFACLPTAFASQRPPPALIPLLSPILRQRVQLLSVTSTSESSWLSLLNWDAQKAAKLAPIIENLHLEPHPVSGEIELEDVDDISYRKLDAETLHARLEVSEFGLLPIFIWVDTDEAGGGSGWRLTELRALEDKDDGSEWYSSIGAASEHTGVRSASTKPNGQVNGHTNGQTALYNTHLDTKPAEEEDDDDYWASYDRTPSRTPAKHSPAPPVNTNSRVQLPTTDELEYFARYASEVQPALDAHDPDEVVPDAPPSTLNGTSLQTTTTSTTHPEPTQHTTNPPVPGAFTTSSPPYDSPSTHDQQQTWPYQEPTPAPSLSHPRPSSSSSTRSIDALEKQAAAQTNAEWAIKQHISTDIKSLFRLARGVGMEREEFERVVKTELECLGMMDMDE